MPKETTQTAEQNLGFNASFETQFANSQNFECQSGMVGVVEVGRPEQPGPDEVPIVIAGGWTEDSQTFKGTMQTLHERGRWVITLDHPVGSSKASNYHEVLKKMGIKKVDILAHSGAVLDVFAWAGLDSEQIRNMVLENPAGLNGKDSLPSLGGRFVVKQLFNLTELGNPNTQRATINGIKNLAGVEKLKRGLDEARAISKADVTQAIDIMRALGHKIGILQSNADPIFIPEVMHNQIVTGYGETAAGERYANNFRADSYASINDKLALHDDLINHPERGAVAADEMLRFLERA